MKWSARRLLSGLGARGRRAAANAAVVSGYRSIAVFVQSRVRAGIVYREQVNSFLNLRPRVQLSQSIQDASLGYAPTGGYSSDRPSRPRVVLPARKDRSRVETTVP